MKTILKKLGILVVLTQLICAAGLKAQTVDSFSSTNFSAFVDLSGVLDLNGTDMMSLRSWSDDQLTLFAGVLGAVSTVPMSSLPTNRLGQLIGSTFWSLQNPGTPIPGDVIGVDVWPMADGSFLLDDLDYDYSGGLASPMRMGAMADGLPSLPGGGGTNYYALNSVTNTYNYGTNLWISITNVASYYVSGFVSNTTGNMQIEIQYTTDLAFEPWQSAGWYVYGSSLTNWTAWVEPAISSSNLFLRAVAYTDDGSGLPISWQLEYFGTTGVDPNGDPMGDGWSNIQKFENGMNPNVFYTPEAPRLAVSPNFSSGVVNVSWMPILAPATNYTVNRFDVQGSTLLYSNTFNVSGSTFSLQDSALAPQAWYFNPQSPGINTYYQIQAHYSVGDSAWSAPAYVKPDQIATVSVVAGPQGSSYLSVASLPADVAALRVTVIDSSAENYNNYSFNVTNDISVSSFTNGLYLLPSTVAAPPLDSYGNGEYAWYVTLLNNSRQAMGSTLLLTYGFADRLIAGNQNSMVAPFLDGRQQLKQNLIFLFRAATKDAPFQFTDVNGSSRFVSFTNQNQFVVADFIGQNNSGYTFDSYTDVDPLVPFVENYLFRNFVFNTGNADGSGHTTTGVSGDYADYDLTPLVLTEPATYSFNSDMISGVTATALLPASSTYWLCSYPLDSPNYEYSSMYLGEIGVVASTDASFDLFYTMPGNVSNYWGLPFLSAVIAYDDGAGGLATSVVNPANPVENVDGYFYPQTAQPMFQLDEYDFWARIHCPESAGFATTNKSDFFVAPVGGSVSVNGYAKLALQNGYPGVYAYLGQYFTNAFEIDTNGNITTIPAGVLSPYGKFFATEPGPVALVTMPDIDTGDQGTCAVYSVSLNVDKNHDGIMDVSFNGADNTSFASPDQVWVNDNYDRWHEVDCTLGFGCDSEQDDMGPDEMSAFPSYQQVPDCDYVTSTGQPAIPCNRDLEDYFRLWTPGLASAMKAMPLGYSVQLTLTGTGGIRIFQAVESDGGTNYLFDETTASNQVNNAASLYLGVLTSASPINLNIVTNFNEHFIFCGTTNGTAQIDLQILDQNTNVVADAPLYLQINEIKQMYERWTVGDNNNATITPPLLAPIRATDRLQAAEPFEYPTPQNTNTPYILYVHGWNMESWEKDRFAETAYKRLYWQGYQGRLGLYRWPTSFGFSGIISAAIDGRNYDNSESNSWASATGLTNLLTQLNSEYPGHVYVIAHSMGNVVTGEALRRSGSQLVNTYIAMQAAVASHAYDPTTTTYTTRSVPDDYAHYYTSNAPCYFNAPAGAGNYINFFNTNDYALSWYIKGQLLKPDNGLGGLAVNYPGYFYSSSSGFYKIVGSATNDTIYLNFPTNTYEIFAYDDPSTGNAIGAQPDVGGVFNDQQVELDISPFNFRNTHKYHSAEFRSDNQSRAVFWNAVMSRLFPPP